MTINGWRLIAACVTVGKRLKQRMLEKKKFEELAGFPKVKQQESKYLPAEELKKKYDGAVGL